MAPAIISSPLIPVVALVVIALARFCREIGHD